MLTDQVYDVLKTILDDTSTARQDYELLLTQVQKLREDYRRKYEKANNLYNLMLGHRDTDFI